jgi:hypothetical protein
MLQYGLRCMRQAEAVRFVIMSCHNWNGNQTKFFQKSSKNVGPFASQLATTTSRERSQAGIELYIVK